jgi:hypothetical protein
MNVIINEDYRITSDQYNVNVERRKLTDPTKRPGFDASTATDLTPKESWAPVAHCRDVAHALTWYVDYRVRTSEATTLTELRDLITAYQDEVKSLYGTAVIR